MRTLIFALLFSLFSYGQDMTVVHFNYKWNSSNKFKGLERLRSAKVQYAFVEDQSPAIKSSIKSVPTIVIYKDGKPVKKYEGGLTMKIMVRLEEIQEEINKHKN
jgi:thiol-disulfide isomerase/thioredoxin|tara:strand:- start:172 stop:483 length:312 start_codon:yes stop_codon:yes gene_type:complete